VLNGGDEFNPGNEPQDRLLVAAAGAGPAFVVPTAAARQRPELAVRKATEWFHGLGLEVFELPVLKRGDAQSEALAERAAGGRFFYLVGGDPGIVPAVLRGSAVWRAVTAAWQAGAALAGSSAGAMALGRWSLVMARWPRHDIRRAVPALDLIEGTAVLPHYETFGHRWAENPIADLPSGALLVGVDERSAAVWDGAWTAAGTGSVTVLQGGSVRSFAPGAAIVGIPDPCRAPPDRAQH